MNNNIPYFSAISRQAIVERIMLYAGEDFTLENFYAKAVMHSEQLLSAFQKTEFLPKVLI